MSKKNILILGKKGQVGHALCALDWGKDIVVTGLGRNDLDIDKHTSLLQTLSQKNWDFVINATAYKNVELAETERDKAHETNVTSVGIMADICAQKKIPLFHYSTDYVFDGAKGSPYKETDAVNPLNQYGSTKEAGERVIRETNPLHYILRISWVYGHHGENFLKKILRLCQEQSSFTFPADQVGAPTLAHDVATTTKAIILKTLTTENHNFWGTYHYTSAPPTTWYEVSQEIVRLYNQLDPTSPCVVHPITTIESKTKFGLKAERPLYSYLDCQKILDTFHISPQNWKEKLQETFEEIMETSQK